MTPSRAALLAIVVGGVTGAGWTAPSGHHGHADSGVLTLDLHAEGTTVDALSVEKNADGVRLVHRRSSDAGRSWGPPHRVPTSAPPHSPHRGADPQIAARGDRVVVVWTGPGTSKWGSGPLRTAVSSDGGRTWSAGPDPADDRSTEGHGYADLAVDGQGRFHLVWLDGRRGKQGLRAASSEDAGGRWSANQTLDDATCECCVNRVTASADAAYVLYRDTGPRDMAVAASTDGGRSWSRRGTAGAFGWSFEGCPHVGGGIATTGTDAARALFALVWTGDAVNAGLHLVTSPEGGAWGPTGFARRPKGHHADLAASGPVLAAVWDESEAGGTAVLSALSSDGGRTWPAPRRLSASGVRASHPLIVGTTPGHFVAAWTERAGEGPLAWRSAILP